MLAVLVVPVPCCPVTPPPLCVRCRQALRTHDPYRQLLSAVDKSSIKVEVENRLGVDATLELDWGDEL